MGSNVSEDYNDSIFRVKIFWVRRESVYLYRKTWKVVT